MNPLNAQTGTQTSKVAPVQKDLGVWTPTVTCSDYSNIYWWVGHTGLATPTFLQVKALVDKGYKYDKWDPNMVNAGTAQGSINANIGLTIPVAKGTDYKYVIFCELLAKAG